MTTEPRDVPHSSDPLGETLHLLRLTGVLYCRAELTAPWGIDLPPLEGCMMLHVITAGRCWLEVGDETPRLVERGSLVLVPHGAGHRMRSALEVRAEPLFDLPVEQVSERYEVLRTGGGGEPTQTLCVVVRFDHAVAEQLVRQLPAVLQLDAWDDGGDGWLSSTLRFIAREARELRPGGETVITRLADVLVIQMIRSWIEMVDEPELGWLAALKDPRVGRALHAMHREPEEAWTVATLARVAGMSRSAFSERFHDLVGESPLHYLTRWRMQLAQMQLRDTEEPIAVLAGRCGYRSEASFCRAFKRIVGTSPGAIRRAGRPGIPAAPGGSATQKA